MPTPKKGPRFGRDPAHQRLIMANMCASLFEAGAITTTVVVFGMCSMINSLICSCHRWSTRPPGEA